MSKMPHARTNYRYKFSFVMPIYNTEEYLDEAVQSVLKQKLNFKKNCEIIFINDGSTDMSEEICLRYQSIYPDNIKYFRQENKGVSAARNRGIESAEGKYVSFLDSDDMISKDTLSEVYNFFEENQEDIDVVAIKMEYFEARSGPHGLNFKFNNGDRIIDLSVEYDHIQTAIGSTFIKKSKLINNSFDERLQTVEDGKLLMEIITPRMKYGVVSGPTYYYRRRLVSSSASGGQWSNISHYVETPKYAFKELLDRSHIYSNSAKRSLQYFVMYHLRASFKKDVSKYINQNQVLAYRRSIVDILSRIDDEVIISQKNFGYKHKVYALSLKYDYGVSHGLHAEKDGMAYWGKLPIYSASKVKMTIDSVVIQDEEAIISGYFNGYLIEGYKVVALVNDREVDLKIELRNDMSTISLGETIYSGNGFTLSSLLRKDIKYNTVKFYTYCGGRRRQIKRIVLKATSGLDRRYKKTFKHTGGYLVARIENGTVISRANTVNVIKKRLLFRQEVLRQNLSIDSNKDRGKVETKRRLLARVNSCLSIFRAPTKLYWWRYRGPEGVNFGDEITRHIIWSIWGLRTEWAEADEASVAGAGSIIELLQDKTRGNPIYIWGSGLIEKDSKIEDDTSLRFSAVRGSLTRERINHLKRGYRNIALGDPGLLASRVFKRAKSKTHKIGIVAHYTDSDNEQIKLASESSNIKIINPLQEPDIVAYEITSCEYILSSSLHGLIFADSFGIPNNWMPLSGNLKGGDYKFKDYYSATSRKLTRVDPSILRDDTAISNAISSYVPVKDLKDIQKRLIQSFPVE